MSALFTAWEHGVIKQLGQWDEKQKYVSYRYWLAERYKMEYSPHLTTTNGTNNSVAKGYKCH